MRIHQLTISAFGPFPGTHVIDFEELNDAGVFLVTGPTGAGKTSILDAVCFALFGQVPGGRGVKALRSDHGDPEARPEVVLDFSIAARRFVVRRTPEWSRPKRRGEGTTPEKASAAIIETTDGTEQLLSSRTQEVGHFLSDLIGMTASQFQQVAMLPQGEFQTFLRASSQERHDVLQQLFRTERFTRIEDWVHDHSRRLRDAAAGGEAAVRRLVDTMADRAGVSTPPDLAAEALVRSASDGAVLPWADEVVAAVVEQLDEAAVEHDASTVALQDARTAHDDAVRAVELRARRDRAQELLDHLADNDVAARSRELVEADERAGRCLPVLRLLDESQAALEEAETAYVSAAAAAPGIEDAGVATQQVISRLARVEALLPRERELRKTRETFRAGTDALEALGPRIAETQRTAAEIPTRRSALIAAVERSGDLARTRPAAEAALQRARAAAEAARLAAETEEQLAGQRDRAAGAREAYADARERMLDVIARRLSGMAAELATGLRDGDPCQVCGSREHPSPAASTDDAVDEAAQLAATTEAEALRVVHEAVAAQVQETELRLQGLRQQSGGLSPDEATAERALCQAELDSAVEAGRAETVARAEVAALDGEAARLDELLRQLETESARVAQTVDGLADTAEMLEREIAAELGDHPTLSVAVGELSELIHGYQALAETTSALARARTAVERHRTAALESAAEHGFQGLDEVRLAALDEPTRAQLRLAVRDHERAVREAEAILADPAVGELGEEQPDLALVRATLAEATSRDAAAARAHHVRHETAAALESMRERLAEALQAWAPARERFLTADSMSRLVRGMGADNQLQLRLSSYVLATRLDQVVGAANERLTHMREQRYLLERASEATRRGSQSGLGLRVVDEWTGETRGPATLSGGETFVVSLALALGLSDVVSTESGGVQIGTLFIDEGFGMLDLDTLDDVMDRLDGLRAGGRTVGVVSHVTELRNRIPTQLHVAKQRDGSSVSVTTLIA